MNKYSNVHGVFFYTSYCEMTYLRKPLLVPARANDESHQLSLLKPAQWEFRALTQEIQHLIQGEGTLSRHRDECWEGGEKNQFIQWIMFWD